MKKPFVFTLILIITMIPACSIVKEYAGFEPRDGKYDTGYPAGYSSDTIEKALESVFIINSMAYYVSFRMPEGTFMKLEDIRGLELKNIASSETRFDKQGSGTATVISSTEDDVLLLTCSHIIDYEDTLITYYSSPLGMATPFVESIAIKISQNNFVAGFPEGGVVEVIALDRKNDIAILGQRISNEDYSDIPSFSFKIGDANKLQWGNFTYIIGYPRNIKMITTGIVSKNMAAGGDQFFIDAVINRGLSGGLALAVLDGLPNLELVGMIRSTPSDPLIYLTPRTLRGQERYQETYPYRGDIFVRNTSDPKYGITRVIPVNRIQEFISSNKPVIISKGYTFPKRFQ